MLIETSCKWPCANRPHSRCSALCLLHRGCIQLTARQWRSFSCLPTRKHNAGTPRPTPASSLLHFPSFDKQIDSSLHPALSNFFRSLCQSRVECACVAALLCAKSCACALVHVIARMHATALEHPSSGMPGSHDSVSSGMPTSSPATPAPPPFSSASLVLHRLHDHPTTLI